MSETIKKNILYVNPFYQDISGADESLTLILRGLDKNLFNPIVAVPQKGSYAKKFEECGAKVIALPFARIKRSLNPFYIIGYAFSQFLEIPRFKKIIREYKIDIVHTNMEVVLSSGIAAKLCKVKSVYHYRHNAYDKPKIVYDVFIGLISKIADTIFVISKAVGEAFYRRGIKDKVKVLYNAIETAKFQNERRENFFINNFQISRNDKVVVTVGRINKRKNLEDFVKMASLVVKKRGDTKFFIVGEAHFKEEQRYKKNLLAMIKDLNLEDSVILAGKHGAIPYVMNSADIITLSSCHEGFGRVLVEAMAVGKPLVGSDSGAIPEIMDYCECGVIYPIGDAEAFAKAVIKLLDDPDECKRLGEAGKKRVKENFTLEAQRAKIEEEYKKLFHDPQLF